MRWQRHDAAQTAFGRELESERTAVKLDDGLSQRDLRAVLRNQGVFTRTPEIADLEACQPNERPA